MDKNRVVAYSLLAHVNNSSAGIRDLNDIFVPLVKRALSKLAGDTSREGQLADLKEVVDQLYSLDIPYPLLKSFLLKVAGEINKSGATQLQVFSDGSFVIKDYAFTEFEEVVFRQESELQTLSQVYADFLVARDRDPRDEPSIFAFLDQNRIELAAFFAGSQEERTLGERFSIQADFVHVAANDERLYSILKKVYLGSVISSYLELDIGKGISSTKSLEFVLDTNFLLSILDLQSSESYHTCFKIVEVSNSLGYRLTVLDCTIEEAESLLRRKVGYWEENYFWERLHPESIYHACHRRGLSRTDLEQLSVNLRRALEGLQLNITFVDDSKKYENIARFSQEYEEAKNRNFNPEGVLHDITAVKYVQRRRGRPVTDFAHSVCWFVTHARGGLSSMYSRDPGVLREVVRAEDLVNLLWLSNPRVDISQLTEVGLTQLVAGAITSTFPDVRVLRELGSNIHKYASKDVTSEEIVYLSSAIANRTLRNVEDLNETARIDPRRFVRELEETAYVLKEEQRAKEVNQEKEIADLRRQYEERLRANEEELRRQHQAEVERIRQEAIQSTQERVQADLSEKREKELRLAFGPLQGVKAKLDKMADSKARSYILVLAGTGLLLWMLAIYAVYRFDWSDIEPIAFIAFGFPLLYYVLVCVYFLATGKELNLSPVAIFDYVRFEQRSKLYYEFEFDISYYQSLERLLTESETSKRSQHEVAA